MCHVNQASMPCVEREDVNVVHSLQDVYSCDMTFLSVQLFESLYLNVRALLVVNVQNLGLLSVERMASEHSIWDLSITNYENVDKWFEMCHKI